MPKDLIIPLKDSDEEAYRQIFVLYRGKVLNYLGYRFVLVNTIIPKAGEVRGQQLLIKINLRNDGYASSNPRVAKLIMKSQANGQVFVYDLSSTVQKWLPDNINISERLLVNEDMSAGTYDLFLYLPDTYQSLSNRSEYAIRFANQDVWDDTTGYNNLHTSVVIK